MVRRKTLTDDGVAALKPRSKRYAHPDPELRLALYQSDAKRRQVIRRCGAR